MSMNQLRDLCVRMKELQAKKEKIDAEAVELGKQIDQIRLREIPELMASLNLKNATFPGVGRVQLASDLYCSTVAGKKDQAMQWLRDCGYEDVISETYNASTMKSIVRGLIEKGAEVPDFLNVTPFIRASVVKAS